MGPMAGLSEVSPIGAVGVVFIFVACAVLSIRSVVMLSSERVMARAAVGVAHAWRDQVGRARQDFLDSLRFRDEAYACLDGVSLAVADDCLRGELRVLGGLAGAW